jgi:linoleoyl-CoA desaturase
MTGNLSYQIEHHLFPDLPSNRYQEIAPKIRQIFDDYGLRYTTGPLPKQVGSAWGKVFRLSLPNNMAADLAARLKRRPTRAIPPVAAFRGRAGLGRSAESIPIPA